MRRSLTRKLSRTRLRTTNKLSKHPSGDADATIGGGDTSASSYGGVGGGYGKSASSEEMLHLSYENNSSRDTTVDSITSTATTATEPSYLVVQTSSSRAAAAVVKLNQSLSPFGSRRRIKEEQEEKKLGRLEVAAGNVPRDPRYTNTTSEALGSFFRHLSASSLAQIAKRLKTCDENDPRNAGVSPPSLNHYTMLSPIVSSSGDVSQASINNVSIIPVTPVKEMDRSLSLVFKEYLESRSIVTDKSSSFESGSGVRGTGGSGSSFWGSPAHPPRLTSPRSAHTTLSSGCVKEGNARDYRLRPLPTNHLQGACKSVSAPSLGEGTRTQTATATSSPLIITTTSRLSNLPSSNSATITVVSNSTDSVATTVVDGNSNERLVLQGRSTSFGAIDQLISLPPHDITLPQPTTLSSNEDITTHDDDITTSSPAAYLDHHQQEGEVGVEQQRMFFSSSFNHSLIMEGFSESLLRCLDGEQPPASSWLSTSSVDVLATPSRAQHQQQHQQQQQDQQQTIAIIESAQQQEQQQQQQAIAIIETTFLQQQQQRASNSSDDDETISTFTSHLTHGTLAVSDVTKSGNYDTNLVNTQEPEREQQQQQEEIKDYKEQEEETDNEPEEGHHQHTHSSNIAPDEDCDGGYEDKENRLPSPGLTSKVRSPRRAAKNVVKTKRGRRQIRSDPLEPDNGNMVDTSNQTLQKDQESLSRITKVSPITAATHGGDTTEHHHHRHITTHTKNSSRLVSCSPASRSHSVLGTKQGTPKRVTLSTTSRQGSISTPPSTSKGSNPSTGTNSSTASNTSTAPSVSASKVHFETSL